MTLTAMTSADVRDELHRLLVADLVGPWDGRTETVVGNPRGRYLVGALAPVKVDTTVGIETPATALDTKLDDLRAAEAPLIATVDESSGGVPESDDLEVIESDDPEDADDKGPASKLIAPSSMGLRFRIASGGPGLALTARWGAYAPRREADEEGRTRTYYDRTPHDCRVNVTADKLRPGADLDLPVLERDGAVEVSVSVEVLADGDGTLIIEVALQNRRVTDGNLPPRQWLFQAELEVAAADDSNVFLPIHDALDALPPGLNDEEERLELLYRDRLEFAIGRTCSAAWTTIDPSIDGTWRPDLSAGVRTANRVRTTWMPEAEIPQTIASGVDGTLLSMERLAAASQAEVVEGLTPLISGYREWLDERGTDAIDLPDHLRGVAELAVEDAGIAADRLAEGLALLSSDQDAFRAFQFMNRVMADQRVHSQVAQARSEDATLGIAAALEEVVAKGEGAASWRHFQIGFILMQLPALTDPTALRRSSDDARAELLFFPTGGGKTEAYLGLAAYTFAIRRLQGVVNSLDGTLDGRDGVAVLMRYTLRLLTTQQFQRATALVCAAELVRRRDPSTWGTEPFRIGLWVGSNVSPKSFNEAEEQISAALATEGRPYGVTVLQLQRCPWCGSPISPKQHIQLDRARRRILVHCGAKLGTECPFAEGGLVEDGLPILTVDEEIYRFPPTYLLATVDKFARIAREGQAASLFGHVAERCPRHGYRHPDTPASICTGSSHKAGNGLPKVAVLKTGRLRPPDLVIQDELHLITGALGTAVGLFEVAVDSLCCWQSGADAAAAAPVRPLVVASTATSRNAEAQVRRLYGRGIEIFPPQVLDIADTYFSKEVPVSAKHPGRRYLGVCAHGVKLTLAEIRVSEILLLAGQKLLDKHGEAADPYMTLVGYFSATRELAGMRRYLDDDVTTRITNPDRASGYPRRGTWGLEIGELTSRVSSTDITKTLDRLSAPFDPAWDTTRAHSDQSALRKAEKAVPKRAGDRPYDVILATSMLQVGVDVGRLGLMVVVGQPKNTAEYIQASSRVGRVSAKPGLVVTLANRSRPRDMAHYEQFEHDHRTFYAHVEALSVTPYSDSSLERGLTGVLVSIARVLDVGHTTSYSPQEGAWSITSRFATLENLVDVIARRAAGSGADDRVQDIKDKLTRRLDAWYKKAKAVTAISYTGKGNALLRSPEDGPAFGDDAYLRVANSMREVQPEISLIVRSYGDRIAEPDPPDSPAWVFDAEVEA
ncbi:DISARM system helicase DrmA [Kribbella sp. NBC_01484]|uniref:DISARM system helicase DrmA n=1 Tax=Kribbella sp. NBC_01484 TaxID=2903579 RepID=UPI002E35A6DC|nr:DISARM system helicase DrmA [Kribbella sp. NBC_01484]